MEHRARHVRGLDLREWVATKKAEIHQLLTENECSPKKCCRGPRAKRPLVVYGLSDGTRAATGSSRDMEVVVEEGQEDQEREPAEDGEDDSGDDEQVQEWLSPRKGR